jgi:hypothetical protein
MKNKTWILPVTTIALLTIITFIALPYPFVPLGIWLERLLKPVEDCICFCPWWLFALLQITGSLTIFQFIKTEKQPSRPKYLMLLAFLGLGAFIFHLLAHNYFLKEKMFEVSIFCDWYWLIVLILILIFGILKIKKDKK